MTLLSPVLLDLQAHLAQVVVGAVRLVRLAQLVYPGPQGALEHQAEMANLEDLVIEDPRVMLDPQASQAFVVKLAHLALPVNLVDPEYLVNEVALALPVDQALPVPQVLLDQLEQPDAPALPELQEELVPLAHLATGDLKDFPALLEYLADLERRVKLANEAQLDPLEALDLVVCLDRREYLATLVDLVSLVPLGCLVLRVARVPLARPVSPEPLVPVAQQVHLENLEPLVKRVTVVIVVALALLVFLDAQGLEGRKVIWEHPGRLDSPDLKVQGDSEDKLEPLVLLAQEAIVASLADLDLREKPVLLADKVLRDALAPPDQLVCLVNLARRVTLVWLDLLVDQVLLVTLVFLDYLVTRETVARLGVTDEPDPQGKLELLVLLVSEVYLVLLAREE